MFSESLYDESLLNRLSSLIDEGKLPHAIILDGGTDSSRDEIARYIALSLMCKSTGKRPCGECVSCKKIMLKSHPDLITIEAEDKKKTISVDIVRQMRDDAYILPNESDSKIYIIPKADTMLAYAQNALLKILEEPPEYTLFILMCDYHTFLLPTVISRSVVFNTNTVHEYSKEPPDDQSDALKTALEIVASVLKGDEFRLMSEIGAFDKKPELIKNCTQSLIQIFRDALVVKSGGKVLLSGQEETVLSISKKLDNKQIFDIIEAVKSILESVEMHANNNLTMARLCSTLIQSVVSR
ncbi:MAG: hypothetical protein LBH71_00120 [Oscillospiraceae bacterium]|jgi:DNA polymerase-3 subunit delta'|nr:hypothetical protein [Oscillospiraceae bacterium]